MATIEDKIEIFSKIVNEKMQQELHKELEGFELQKKYIIIKKMHELENIRKKELQDARKKVEIRCNEIISREKGLNQSSVLEIKKGFINEIINELRSRFVDFTQNEEYERFLVGLTEKTVQDLEKGDYSILMTENDRLKYGKAIESRINKYEGKSFSIEIVDEDIIGGIILQNKTGKFRVNFSLASKLEECIEIVGVKISEKIG